MASCASAKSGSNSIAFSAAARILSISAAASDRVRLILSGTGFRFRTSLSNVIVTIGGAYAEVVSAGAQSSSAGVDQVEVLVPRSLAGRDEVDVLLTVDGLIANPVKITIQ